MSESRRKRAQMERQAQQAKEPDLLPSQERSEGFQELVFENQHRNGAQPTAPAQKQKKGASKRCMICGTGGLFVKLSEDGLCMDCLQKELREVKGFLTPEMRNVKALQELLAARQRALFDIENQIEEKQQEHNSTCKALKQAKSNLIVAEDSIELETFALYEPKYTFAKAEEYKAKLDVVRARQKQMVKENSAISGRFDWAVNGSKAEGKKLGSDMVKLCLRSFNNECDAAVTSTKFNNFDRCKDRINKAADTIEKLGRVMHISITSQYLKSKIDELHLAYEFQLAKEKEKEEARAIREQQREAAKLAKEIEAARKETEKEREHYQKALRNIEDQLSRSTSGVDKELLLTRRSEILQNISSAEIRLKDIDYRQENQKAGYVYIISNIGSFGENVYKIGMTRRLEPMERVDELGDASVPFGFDVHAMIFSSDAPKLEAALHQSFSDRRVNRVNTRREYFAVSLEEIKRVVRRNHDKTVEFTDSPEAEQYRQSLLMLPH